MILSLLDFGDDAAPLWVLSVLDRVLLVLDELVLPEAAELVGLDTDGVVGRMPDDSLHRDVCEVEPRSVVESEHRPGSGGSSLLNVTRNVELPSAKNYHSSQTRLTLERET